MRELKIINYKLKIIFSSLFLLFSIGVMAQSNLTYELKVGTTAENKLLAEFPESYAGEKINITVNVLCPRARSEGMERLAVSGKDELDFIFSNVQSPMSNLQSFDSIYVYTDESNVSWTVWRNNKPIKNRAQRVMVANAYKTFEEYVYSHQPSAVRYQTGWIWFVLAGLILLGALLYIGYILWERRKEKNLSSVEQETLRRKRMGLRRHYASQAYLWLLLLVLYAPIALIAVFSFTKSKVLGNWTGFSMDLYANLFTGQADAGLNSAIWYTVVIALIAAVGSTILGTLAAIGIYNMRARSRKMVSFLNSVP